MLTSPVTAWVVAGLTLSLLELLVPGVYLIWFGFAAFVMSVIVYLTPLALTSQLIWFALISAVFACIGLYIYRFIFNQTKVFAETLGNRRKGITRRRSTMEIPLCVKCVESGEQDLF